VNRGGGGGGSTGGLTKNGGLGGSGIVIIRYADTFGAAESTTGSPTFTTTGGTVIKKSPGFPGSVTVTSATNPVIIEVWQHSATVIFLNYLGTYN
jgi:hypothetical protein